MEAQEGFETRVFCHGERVYCRTHSDPYPIFAGRFAAKEACVKALGEGFGSLGLQDIEVKHMPSGKPYLSFSHDAKKHVSAVQFEISIAHERDYAVATVIAFTDRTDNGNR